MIDEKKIKDLIEEWESSIESKKDCLKDYYEGPDPEEYFAKIFGEIAQLEDCIEDLKGILNEDKKIVRK